MTNDEIDRALRQLRLGGMADAVAVRAQQARADSLGPLDFLGYSFTMNWNGGETDLSLGALNTPLPRPEDTRYISLGINTGFDRALIFELATARFIEQHDDVLMLGTPALARATLRKRLAWLRSPPAS